MRDGSRIKLAILVIVIAYVPDVAAIAANVRLFVGEPSVFHARLPPRPRN